MLPVFDRPPYSRGHAHNSIPFILHLSAKNCTLLWFYDEANEKNQRKIFTTWRGSFHQVFEDQNSDLEHSQLPSNQRDFLFLSGFVTLGKFQQALEEWIPPASAWKGDNCGIQVGRATTEIRNILLSLDATLDVAKEAMTRRANLVVTHHPLLFRPLRSLTDDSRAGAIALFMAERNINLYAAHTNLDHVNGGVSFVMASLLGLRNVRMLSHLPDTLVKVSVFVPASHLEKVAKAMHGAGGGGFTHYEECSFRTEGIGTFKPKEGATPFIGSKGVLEKTPEVKLEMPVETWKLGGALAAMFREHPYEEVAYDVSPLQNRSEQFGLGAIGEFTKPVPPEKFLSLIKRSFGTKVLRYTGRTARPVRHVAVCGGAGGELVSEAIRQRADAYITADIKYHGFQDAEKDIFLIDAGHFETERHVLPVLAERIKEIITREKSEAKVFITKENTNPVTYY